MKYFTKEVKIALTAIVAVAALFVGINFLKGVNIFQPTNAYYVKFANISGLTTSNPVFANGYPVGTVRSIDYNYDEPGSILVGIELDDAMRVPAGTRAEVYYVVSRKHHVAVVLHDNHRISHITKFFSNCYHSIRIIVIGILL